MSISQQVENAATILTAGGIIAYPTESVFGLGCDPFNQKAVEKLLSLKQRPIEKGLILIASHVQQILSLIQPIEANDLARALKTWPGHETWIFPKTELVPEWISGDTDSVAVRVSAHPFVTILCDKLNMPLVSTSANLSKQPIMNSLEEIKNQFGDKIDGYIDAPLGERSKPSKITIAHTHKQLR